MGWQSTELDFYFTCIVAATLLSEQEPFDPRTQKNLLGSVFWMKINPLMASAEHFSN